MGLLKGSFVFVADLAPGAEQAGCTPRIEFMRVSSYGSGTTSSGIVSLMGDAPDGVKGEPVLLVDDIQDTGRTLAFTRSFLLERGARRVWTCTLLDKPSRREEVESEVDFVGFVDPRRVRRRLRHRLGRALPALPFIGRIVQAGP